MPRSVSRLFLPAFIGLVAVFVLVRMTMLTVAFTDYENEALPSMNALLGGDVAGFIGHLPAYGGSLIMRAPFALLADLFGSGELGVFHAMALPCLVAALAFGLVLFAHTADAQGRAPVGGWLALALVAVNPVTISALDLGHPEELLGAVLCAAAVLAGMRDRPLGAGVLLGLAGANKAWAILAVIPVLMTLSRGRLLMLGSAGALCGLVLAPVFLHGGGSAVGAAGGQGAASTGGLFHPWQVWWFLGSPGATGPSLVGMGDGFRTSPGSLTHIAHPLVIGLPIAGSLFIAARGRRSDALLLLATCMLARCVLDPWDNAYYHLPFLLALTAHEAVVRRRAPVGALAATACVYLINVLADHRLYGDVQAALYLAWAVPALATMSMALVAPERLQALAAPLLSRLRTALPSLARVIAPTRPAGSSAAT